MRLTDFRPIRGAEYDGETDDSPTDGGDLGEVTGGEGEESGQEEEKGQPDVRQAIDNLSERMDTFMQGMQTQQEDPLDFLDEYDTYDPDESYEDPTQEEAGGDADDLVQSADQIVENLVQQKVQEQLAPHLQAQYEERRHEQVVGLEQKYPELQEQDNATPLLQNAVELARSLGEPDLAYEAPFLETVHLRMKAESARAEENSGEGEQEAPIEGAGGSNTGGGSGDAAKQAADLIVGASKNRGIFQ